MTVTIEVGPYTSFLKVKLFRVSDNGGLCFDHAFKRYEDAKEHAEQRAQVYREQNHTVTVKYLND